MTEQKKSTDKLEIYQSERDGKWRYRRLARNGRNKGASEQGFAEKYYALKMAVLNNQDIAKHRVFERKATANVVLKSKLIDRYL